MALPTTLYIRTNSSTKPTVITNIEGWWKGAWYECRETYRDIGWEGGKIPPTTSGTGSITTSQNMPAVGDESKVITPLAWSSLRHAAPDDWAHVPPRPKWVIETGWIIAIGGGGSPSITTHNQALASIPVTVSTSTYQCTPVVANSHTLDNETPVTIGGNGLPGGTRPDVIYRIVLVDGDAFKLRGPDGKIVAFSSTGTAVCIHPVPVRPINLFDTVGLIVIPDSLEPRISTSA